MKSRNILSKYKNLMSKTLLSTVFPSEFSNGSSILGFKISESLDLSYIKPGLIDPYFEVYFKQGKV